MDLHQSLDRFKADLEAYIQAEVSRQLAAQMRTIASGGGRTVSTPASMSTNEADIQASLNELAALAQTAPRTIADNAADRLVSEYGGTLSAPSSKDNAVTTNYLSDLEQISQVGQRAVDMSAYDALTSMNSQSASATLAPQPPQPAAASMTDTSNIDDGGQLSGIQSFLQKIRQRKNLSSN